MRITETDTPLSIAMWDFSWLERRYPGGGYEDWDRALDELADRGYDAVRIDAFPHFVANDPERSWTVPVNQIPFNAWGAPGTVEVEIMPAFTEFIEKCADRELQVGLSTWFRDDETNARMDVETPEDLGAIWIETIQTVEEAGLGDAVCYVDLCNEFPAWIRGEHSWRAAIPSDEPPMREAAG